MSENRKLAAIIFTDIVGFTEFSAKDEPSAEKLNESDREVFNNNIPLDMRLKSLFVVN